MALPPSSIDKELNSKDALAGWVTERVDAWRTWRDNNYSSRWNDYYRLFRGFWIEADKTRDSERSRIIGTELSQAIETSVAEIEDAIFARDRWIDIVDDVVDEDHSDMELALKLILDDFEQYNVKGAISEILLNGALYGTGIGKIVVDRVDVPYVDMSSGIPAAVKQKKYCVKLIPISPRNFIIDPNANHINEAMGCAHETKVPMSVVQDRISKGTYRKFPLTSYEEQVDDLNALAEFGAPTSTAQACKIVEWHGLVPKSYLSSTEKLFDDLKGAEIQEGDVENITIGASEGDSEELVEAIVTIVNDDHVARAVINPFIFGDRSFVAFPFDTVPNRFWGRGVAEKGYNPQKALDAEIRARIDALGFSTAPMMGIDSTKIPRGESFAVKPGKNILTVGNPADALMPLKFPPPDPYTFQQTQELREMIQRGTGSYELPANVDNSRMAATSMSMIVGSMIKRSRRVLANIERHFLTPLVTKALWRYMQFDPERYPMRDYRFKVKGSMGIMAREFEQGQLVSLLSTVPSESPAFWMLMKGIYFNSSLDDREAMIQFCDGMIEQASNPQEEQPDPKIMVDMERLKFESSKWEDERDLKTRELMQKDEMFRAEGIRDMGEGKMQASTAVLQLVKAETEQLKVQSEAILNLAKAESERNKAELETYRASLEAVKIQVGAMSAKSTTGTSSESGESNPAATVPAPSVPDAPETKDESGLEGRINDLTELLKAHIGSMSGQNLGDNAAEQTKGILSQLSEGYDKSRDEGQGQGGGGLEQAVADLAGKVDMILQGLQGNQEAPQEAEEDIMGQQGVQIERDANGLVTSVNGRPVQRGDDGLIAGIE